MRALPLASNIFEGVLARQYRTARSDTCNEVIELAKKHAVILIKSSPQSGKTALLQLIWLQLQQRKWTPYYLSCSDRGCETSVDEFMQASLGGRGLASIINGAQTFMHG